ncbi:MAG: hypothetical protein ACEPOW_09800 [Bacteroidales bacterium]
MKKSLSTLLFLFFLLTNTIAQKKDMGKQFIPKGYLQNLGTLWMPSSSNEWKGLQTEQLRLDFNPRFSKSFQANLGIRNIFSFGSIAQLYYSIYQDDVYKDKGYLNLSWRYSSNQSYVLYSILDRANVSYTYKNLEVSVGRQRINWSQNLVWNPNDIFNTFNYFDFDYIERPGSDAVLIQYYTGETSSLQIAAKLDKENQLTAASMFKFNRWNYDFQVLAGVIPNDITLGFGWSGGIGGAGFNGECTYLLPRKKLSFQSSQIIISSGANYTFQNQLYVHISGIFNSLGGTKQGGSFIYSDRMLSIKDLTVSRYSLFGEFTYPVTPLITVGLAGIWNPDDHSSYYSPSFSFSLSKNVDLLLLAQILNGKSSSEFAQYGQFYFMKLKYSFL